MSEVDVTGRLLRTFTDVRSPRYLLLDSEGRVFVADYNNRRILLLNSELQLVLIDTDSQVKLWWPTRLSYDERTSRLYVVHRSKNKQLWSDVISLFYQR